MKQIDILQSLFVFSFQFLVISNTITQCNIFCPEFNIDENVWRRYLFSVSLVENNPTEYTRSTKWKIWNHFFYTNIQHCHTRNQNAYVTYKNWNSVLSLWLQFKIRVNQGHILNKGKPVCNCEIGIVLDKLIILYEILAYFGGAQISVRY